MNQIFEEYIKNKQSEGLYLSIMDVNIKYDLTPQKLKDRNYELEVTKSKFDTENKLVISESIFQHNSGFYIYLSKRLDTYDVKILHQPKHIDEIILFLTNLNRNEKHRFRSVK